MPDRTLVVSATNLLARGYLVVPTDRKSRAGDPGGARSRAVRRVVASKLRAHAVAVIDRGAPRPGWPPLLAQQVGPLAELMVTLGMHVVSTDDEPNLVAAYARAALEAGGDAIVVGADKRYAQLVNDRLWWYDANKDTRYTAEIVQKRFTVPPASVAAWLGMVGDDDALPGVKGIGAKGATAILEAYGTAEAALATADSRTPR